MERALIFFIALILPLSTALCQPDSFSPEEEIDLYFTIPGGHYRGSVQVELQSPRAVIYYSLNGSRPGKWSKKYTGPIELKRTAILRAVAYRDQLSSEIVSHTYFIDEPPSDLPIVSIGISPNLLFDHEKGIFMQGTEAIDTLWNIPGANFWTRREYTASTEIFESDGQCVHRSLSGFRLFGGISRLFPQKSMVIVARDEYGEKRIKHRIFGDKGLKKFKFLVLRNSGSDWGKSHFRDAFMTGLTKDWDIEQQDSRPAHVYLNGKYWGIYNIREKINRYFISDHRDVDKDSVDIIEHRMTVKRGSSKYYRELLDYLETHDLSRPEYYAYVRGLMEVDNFMDFQIAQIFFDNRDGGGNIRFWRPRQPEGRWRWILFDTDWGFGLHHDQAYAFNSLNFHTEADGPHWPNPPWSTFILRKLLENEDFRLAFLNRFADRLNTCFDSSYVLAEIDRHVAGLLPEIGRHLDRWNLSESFWRQHVDRMREFGRHRNRYMWQFLSDRFEPGPLKTLELSSGKGGYVVLNENLEISGRKFKGRYFAKVPVSIRAVPHYGYRFSHWEGIAADDSPNELYLSLEQWSELELKAVFEPYFHPLTNRVIINEIGPNNKKSEDWIEIFNNTEKRISLEGWKLTDSKHAFILPKIFIDPHDYLVVCEDSAKFVKHFSDSYNAIGDLGFGINKRKETIGLFTDDNALIDSLSYELEPTDSVFSLSLLLPRLDNSDLENWEMRYGDGTPNSPNPYYVESRIRKVQALWMQAGIAAGIVLICLMLLYLRRRESFG